MTTRIANFNLEHYIVWRDLKITLSGETVEKGHFKDGLFLRVFFSDFRKNSFTRKQEYGISQDVFREEDGSYPLFREGSYGQIQELQLFPKCSDSRFS